MATYLTLIFVLYAGFLCVASKVVQTLRASLGVDEVWDTLKVAWLDANCHITQNPTIVIVKLITLTNR